MHTPIKTTLNFDPLFHARLKTVAQELNKPMAEVIQEHLLPVLDDIQKERHRKVFDALQKLNGIVTDGPIDASTTIDEYLYGWDGKQKQEGRAT